MFSLPLAPLEVLQQHQYDVGLELDRNVARRTPNEDERESSQWAHLTFAFASLATAAVAVFAALVSVALTGEKSAEKSTKSGRDRLVKTVERTAKGRCFLGF